jgi:hypothetical protein
METMMDTEDYQRLLEAFDGEDRKAMAIAKAIDNNTVTLSALDRVVARFEQRMETGFAKIDTRFAQLEAKLDASVARLDARIDTGIARLDAKIDTSVAELRKEIAQTRTEAANSRGEMFRWMATFAVTIGIALSAVAFAIVRLTTP